MNIGDIFGSIAEVGSDLAITQHSTYILVHTIYMYIFYIDLDRGDVPTVV
jgi:hypothetical protein